MSETSDMHIWKAQAAEDGSLVAQCGAKLPVEKDEDGNILGHKHVKSTGDLCAKCQGVQLKASAKVESSAQRHADKAAAKQAAIEEAGAEA